MGRQTSRRESYGSDISHSIPYLAAGQEAFLGQGTAIALAKEGHIDLETNPPRPMKKPKPLEELARAPEKLEADLQKDDC